MSAYVHGSLYAHRRLWERKPLTAADIDRITAAQAKRARKAKRLRTIQARGGIA